MKKMLLIIALALLCIVGLNKPVYSQVDLYLDEINVYVDEYGSIQIYTLPDTIQQIARATILVGTGPEDVFDYTEDVDVEEPTQLLSTPSYGDYEIYGSYNNDYSGAPPNVLEKMNIYCWQNQNSIIVKYTIINREVNPIDAIFGLDYVPEVENSASGGDTVTYSNLSKIISVRKTESVGFKPLSDDFKSLGLFVWYAEYKEDTTYYRWLTYDSFDSLLITDPNDPNVDDPVLIPAYNSVNIAPGDSIVQYVAISYGINETAMLASLQEAQQKYYELTSVEADYNTIPDGYSLEQNYPNPFNPSTNIKFSLPQSDFVSLKVYDVLGNEIETLVSEELSAGSYKTTFNSNNLPSGIYFYTITTSSFTQTRKMNLIK